MPREWKYPDWESLPTASFSTPGTSAKGAKVLTAGGRVLAVTSFGDGIEQAAAASYRTIETIDYQGKYCRTDIGRDLL